MKSSLKEYKEKVLHLLDKSEGSMQLGRIVASNQEDVYWRIQSRVAVLVLVEEGLITLDASGLVRLVVKK